MKQNLKNSIERPTDKFSRIQSLFLSAIQKHLPQEDALKAYLLKFFSDINNIKDRYKISAEGLSDSEIETKMDQLSELLNNKTFFIETMEQLKERNEVSERLAFREEHNPIATEEELEAGVYKDELESQVRDAVFTLIKKGHSTFESGYDSGRDQYIGMHNKNISIPSSIVDFLKEKSFEISTNELEDRTVIIIRPLREEAVTLKEWRLIWNSFAEKMPPIEKSHIQRKEEVLAHKKFREKRYKRLE